MTVSRNAETPSFDSVSQLLDERAPVFYRLDLGDELARINWVSANFTLVTGIDANVVLNDSDGWRGHIHQQDRSTWDHFIHQARQDGEAHAEYRLGEGGDATPYRVHDHLKCLNGGKEWIGCWSPIDAQEHLLTRAREAEDRFQALADASPNVIYVSRIEDGTLVYVSPAVKDMFGHDPADVIGTRTSDYMVTPEHRADIVALLRQDGFFKRHLIAMKRADDHVIMVEASARIAAIGARHFIVAELVDVTAIHDSRAALTASEQRFRDFTAAASDFVWETDADHRLSYISDRYCQITGIAPHDALGLTVPALIRKSGWTLPSMGHINDHLARTRARQPFRDTRYQVTTTEGRICYFSLNGDPVFDANGKFTGYRGVGSDVTERVERREQIINAKMEADQANLAKSKFLASMSHEFRTPLNAILGFGQLIQMNEADNLSKSGRENIGHLLNSGKHLLALIDQLLDLETIERGTLTPDLVAVRIDALIRECLDLLEPLAARQQVTLTVERMDDQLAVTADKLRLKQVLVNLLDNGIKYNHTGGRVDITARRSTGSTVRIAVRDTGHGIPADQTDHVFEEFSRLGREALDIQGAGIGLSLCRRLIGMMGGRIGFDSKVGSGCIFWIELPDAQGPDQSPTPASDRPTWHPDGELRQKAGTGAFPAKEQTPHVPMTSANDDHILLYVEDNPANADLVKALLSTMDGIRLVHAPTAEQGLELAASIGPFLVLMDLSLPGMDGRQALRAMRADDSLKTIPVIALSAHAFDRDIKDAMALGFNDYLTKPLNLTKFQELIRRFLPPPRRG